jgi:hypothetical protein
MAPHRSGLTVRSAGAFALTMTVLVYPAIWRAEQHQFWRILRQRRLLCDVSFMKRANCTRIVAHSALMPFISHLLHPPFCAIIACHLPIQ